MLLKLFKWSLELFQSYFFFKYAFIYFVYTGMFLLLMDFV